MCSNNDEGDQLMLTFDRLSLEKICMKCKNNTAQVVIRVGDPFCQSCFLAYTTHKFRSAFGKSKLIRDGEKVLIAYSGGPSSTAMLHLIQEGKSSRAQKKLRFIPTILWIDESAAYNGKLELGLKQKIEENLQRLSFDYHLAELTEVTDNTSEELQEMFSSIKSNTDKEKLLHVLRRRVMYDVAKREGYSKVVIAETSTKLAIDLLSIVGQGKGAHISYTTGILDDRHPDVKIIRPMREFTSKEVSLYNSFNGLHSLVQITHSTKAVFTSSVDRLTENFVVGLQAEFPSTTSTIMRTGDKLITNPVKSRSEEGGATSTTSCSFCMAPIDTGSLDSASAMASLRWSQELAEKRRKMMRAEQGADNSIDVASTVSSSPETLCYSCTQLRIVVPSLKMKS